MFVQSSHEVHILVDISSLDSQSIFCIARVCCKYGCVSANIARIDGSVRCHSNGLQTLSILQHGWNCSLIREAVLLHAVREPHVPFITRCLRNKNVPPAKIVVLRVT